MNFKIFVLTLVCLSFSTTIFAQLLLGNSKVEVNFRKGPGKDYEVISTISKSELLVILPREVQHGFIEAFDVETNTIGFVYQPLIVITDTLSYQKQNFFEKSGNNSTEGIEVSMVNRTSKVLFVWINKVSFELAPFEKKVLVLPDEEITYFSSSPGLYPLVGKESLKKGESYIWNFSL